MDEAILRKILAEMLTSPDYRQMLKEIVREVLDERDNKQVVPDTIVDVQETTPAEKEEVLPSTVVVPPAEKVSSPLGRPTPEQIMERKKQVIAQRQEMRNTSYRRTSTMSTPVSIYIPTPSIVSDVPITSVEAPISTKSLVLLQSVLAALSSPCIEHVDAHGVLLSTFHKKYSLVLLGGSERQYQVWEVPVESRPTAVHKDNTTYTCIFSLGSNNVEVVRYSDTLTEKNKYNVNHLRAISRNAGLMQYRQSIHVSAIESQDYLIGLKRPWAVGNILCSVKNTAYVATPSVLYRYAMSELGRRPTWTYKTNEYRPIEVIYADENHVVCTSGHYVTVLDSVGSPLSITLSFLPVSLAVHNGLVYIIGADWKLYTLRIDSKILSEGIALDVTDITGPIHVYNERLYFTTKSEVREAQL